MALAGLLLSYHSHGAGFVATEGRSMIAGAAGLFTYSAAAGWVIRRAAISPWPATLGLWTIWLTVAFALWYTMLRS